MDIFSLGVSLLVAILAQGLHILWYSPLLCGKAWRAALKRKADAKIPMKMSLISLVTLILASLIYGFFVETLGMAAAIDYVIFTGLMFVAFTVPAKVMAVIYAGQSRKLIIIDGGFYLVAYSLFGLAHYLF